MATKLKPIRPSATDIFIRAFSGYQCDDGKEMSSHVHLLSLVSAIRDAFEAEGIDIDEVVEAITSSQQVDIWTPVAGA